VTSESEDTKGSGVFDIDNNDPRPLIVNNLANLHRADQTWKVRLTEEEFQRLMFDLQDV